MRDLIVEESNVALCSAFSDNKCVEIKKGSAAYEVDSGIDTSDSCDENKRNIPLIRSERKKHFKNATST